jgi:hypothetical protein
VLGGRKKADVGFESSADDFNDASAAAVAVAVAVDTIKPVEPKMAIESVRAQNSNKQKFIVWPAEKNIFFLASYSLVDTFGLRISPAAKLQWRQMRENWESGWFDMRGKGDAIGNEPDYYFYSDTAKIMDVAHDTIEVRVSVMIEYDPHMINIWSFRLRLENGRKVSDWMQYATDIKLVRSGSIGVPKKPALLLLKK